MGTVLGELPKRLKSLNLKNLEGQEALYARHETFFLSNKVLLTFKALVVLSNRFVVWRRPTLIDRSQLVTMRFEFPNFISRGSCYAIGLGLVNHLNEYFAGTNFSRAVPLVLGDELQLTFTLSLQ